MPFCLNQVKSLYYLVNHNIILHTEFAEVKYGPFELTKAITYPNSYDVIIVSVLENGCHLNIMTCCQCGNSRYKGKMVP